MTLPLVEIAVQDAAGARIAFQEGAERIELCQALRMGGLTPSAGCVASVIETLGDARGIAPLVRPRGGGFVYDADEVRVVENDIRHLTGLGVGAVVVGCLTPAGTVDVDVLRRWVDAAGPADVVFHRALDVAQDPLAAVDLLAGAGVTRVLTSGGAATAADGLDALQALVRRSAGRLQIMAGGGITAAQIPAVRATGVDAVHLSARAVSADLAPSGPGGGETGFDVTDRGAVRAAVAAAHAG